nr:NAD(P)H-hydrate epimerase [Aquincola sp. J276]
MARTTEPVLPLDQPRPLHGIAAARQIESAAAAVLPPHTLMQRAGLAVARLAQALAPHARRVCVLAGPGNNGGDGLEAALHPAAQRPAGAGAAEGGRRRPAR